MSKKTVWTPPEAAIVLGLTVMIITIAFVVRIGLSRHNQMVMVDQDLASIVKAADLFYQEYGMWPSEYTGETGDFRYGREFKNSLVLNALRAIDGPGNRKNLLNVHQIIFLQVEPYSRGLSGLDREDNFLDPWGQPYQIVVDTDLNMTCDITHSIHGQVEDVGIAAWSCGPDGVSDTSDDIKSWEDSGEH